MYQDAIACRQGQHGYRAEWDVPLMHHHPADPHPALHQLLVLTVIL